LIPSDHGCVGIRLLLDLLDDVIPPLMERHHTPGVSVAVFDRAEGTHVRCYGAADASSGRPVAPDTIFEAASLSKPPFALSILELARSGVLDLDRPVAEYLPEPLCEDSLSRAITKRSRSTLCRVRGSATRAWATFFC